MIITFFFNYLNHHQVLVADEMYKLIGDNFRFVATCPRNPDELKGGKDYSDRPYCILAGESFEANNRAHEFNNVSDICVYGAGHLDWMRERAETDKLSFEVSERWLKRGWINVFSPRLLKWWWLYQTTLKDKPFYKLCASAFAAQDDVKLGCYKNRHLKWGYFTSVPRDENTSTSSVQAQNQDENLLCECEDVDSEILMQHQPESDCSARADVLQSPHDLGAVESTKVEASTVVSTSEITPLMWCSRFLKLKHPELPILMAERLKQKGYKFHLDMYGEGELRPGLEVSVERLGLSDVIKFHDNMPNADLMEDMKKHEIFLFTSDRNEGWGAVANESMANGCVLVGSDALGCAPYLIKDGENGFKFKSSKTTCSFKNPDKKSLDSLCEKVEWLLDHPKERQHMRKNAYSSMVNIWSPRHAAEGLLKLISDLQNGKDTSIQEGPCSKA